jgi:tRNA(fMet)-specific endonuclease VapC
MTISLDSSVVIDLANARSQALRVRFVAARAARETLVVSSLVYHEVTYGAVLGGQYELEMRLISTIIGGLPIEPFNRDDALEAGRLRTELRRGGKPFPVMDTLIAGQARFRGWSVATTNLRHFTRMPGLDVQAWLP